ncbi:MAG: helix-turn-helix domain-containing protein [Sphingomonas pseudosanguinis]|uniref:helix-turn-helix domain-containing protein n=1 Tax=Sphingomonas pseudosanguinis TaxID=413712 RepID=UPI003918969A
MTGKPLPGEEAMRELAGVVGDEAATALARQFGGTSVYVPRAIGDHHPLCVMLGRQAADRLAAWTGGQSIAIPKRPERRARVIALRRQRALTIQQIARETDYSERHVYRLLRDHEDARQPDLFDDE